MYKCGICGKEYDKLDDYVACVLQCKTEKDREAYEGERAAKEAKRIEAYEHLKQLKADKDAAIAAYNAATEEYDEKYMLPGQLGGDRGFDPLLDLIQMIGW